MTFSAQAACFLMLLLSPAALAGDYYTWRALAPLPETHGVAGSFAGVSNGALLVVGGAYFETPPYAGGEKIWSGRIFVLESPDGEWHAAGALDHPLAYGGSVTAGDGIILIGGSDGRRHYATVTRLEWVNGTIQTEELPALPRPCANLGAALLGNAIYVAGGQAAPDSPAALHSFWRLRLDVQPLRWEALEPWPGPARILPVVAAQDGAVYVISGAELLPDPGGKPTRRFLTDAYRYRPGEGWERIAEIPRPAVAAPAVAEGPSHIMVFGGDDGANFFRQAELKDRHPGFRHDILAYHTITGEWAEMGSMPFSHVTTPALWWRGQVIIPSGEDRPGHRSPQVYAGAPATPKGHFSGLDYTAMGLYLASLALMGLYLSRREKGTADFFLGGRRVPWWAAGLSIFATQLSSISFMAIPAKAYATDWMYFHANVAIVLIAPVVVFFYLPYFRRLNITTAYEYLEARFNLPVRLFASAAFILYQLGRMAVVLFLPAIALSTVTGIDVYVSILVMGLLCTFYTVLGGIEAVIWTDVLQVAVLLGGALLSLAFIVVDSGGLATVLHTGLADSKFRVVDWSWDYTTPTLWVVLIGGMFANLGPYTSDQTVVQRYLTTKDERAAARSIWTNAWLVIPGTIVWFGLGTALYVFYKGHPQALDPAVSTDAIFPLFIAQQLPAGISGLIIAALFAASMSTLDSSLNSVATAVVTDFFRRFRPRAADSLCLRLARWLTALLGVLATATAALLAAADVGSLWDVFQEVMSLFGGALAGLFALGIFSRRATGPGALVGAAASVVTLYLVKSYTPVHFFLYALVGVLTCIIVGYAASLLLPARAKNLAGLTILTKGRNN